MHYRMSLYLKWAIGFARVPQYARFRGGDLNTPSNTRHLDRFSRVCSALNCKPHIANLITNELRPVTDTSVRNKRRHGYYLYQIIHNIHRTVQHRVSSSHTHGSAVITNMTIKRHTADVAEARTYRPTRFYVQLVAISLRFRAIAFHGLQSEIIESRASANVYREES